MRILTFVFLVFSFSLYAQVPVDFQHVFDSVQFVATPILPGDQVISYSSAGQFNVRLPEGQYQVYISANKTARTFDANLRFSQVIADTIDTAATDSLRVQVITPQFLILVPKKFDQPILNDGKGNQPLFFESENYWYCYVTRTATGQIFSFNPRTGGTTAGNAYIYFNPVGGGVMVYKPPSETLTISIQDPFK